MKAKPGIIFMGTPEFAVPFLETLSRDDYPVIGVVTQPDKPRGRRWRLSPSPVKMLAEQKSFPVFQPPSIRSVDAVETIKSFHPDLIVVVAFGALLQKSLLDVPPLGVINIHASLLPKYRGPAPIQWAIINGDTETGVTAMRMDEGMDTGDILGVVKTPIHDQETFQTLHDKLAVLGASLLSDTLKKMRSGNLNRVPQDHSGATHAPLLKKRDGHIDWHLPAKTIERRIRGLTPWPGAFTELNGKTIRIFKAEAAAMQVAAAPGTVIESKGMLKVASGDGTISILELQVASLRRMPVSEFLRGNPVPEGAIFS